MKTLKHLLLLLITGVSLLNETAAQTPNYSGLQDKILMPEISRESAGDLLVSLLLTRGEFKGNLTTVRVTADEEMKFNVTVGYEGFANGFLIAKLVDAGKTPMQGFQVARVKFPQDKGTIDLSFTIDRKAYPENQDIVVPKLVLVASVKQDSDQGYKFTYSTQKKFKIPVSDANLVTNVSLLPLGSAATLTKAAVKPANVIMPNIRIYDKINKNALLVQPDIKTDKLYLDKVDRQKLNIERQPAPTTPVKVTTPVRRDARVSYVTSPQILATTVLVHPGVAGTRPATPPPPPDPTPQGPGDQAIPLFESLVTDYEFEYPFEITNIRLDVYPDKNKASGYFYYLPSAYYIDYDKDQGHQFVIDYGTSGEASADQTVRMSGKLTHGVNTKEKALVSALIRLYIRKNPQFGYKFTSLAPVKPEGSLQVSFDTDLKQYNISNQSISAPNLDEQIDVSWRTDQANATDISNSLKANVGIIGNLKIKPQNGVLPDQDVPVRIRLADERTIGRFTLKTGWRNQNWQNISPYPVKLRNLHVLWVDEAKNQAAVYTWQLNDVEIPAKSQVKFDHSKLPAWLDNEPNTRYWIEYEIMSCVPCHEDILKKVIHSTTQAQSQTIRFNLLEIFEANKIVFAGINVRTKQATADGTQVQTMPEIPADKDKQAYNSGKIYVPQGEQPDFEFSLHLVTSDGKEYNSDWVKRNSLNVFIGNSQLKEMFPQLITTP